MFEDHTNGPNGPVSPTTTDDHTGTKPVLPLANPITVEAAAAARKELWQTGFRPVAVYNPDQTWHTSPGKAPQGNGWEQRAQRSIPEAATLQPHPRATNTGIWSGGLRPADIDVDDPGIVKQIRDILAEYTFDDVPVRGREGSPRELHVYRAAEGAPAKRSIVGKLGKLEFLGFGNQFVAYGGHPDGGSYIPPVGGYGVADALPALTEEQVTEIFARVAPLIGAVPPKAEPGEHTSGEAQADPLRIAAALNDIPNDGPANWEKWNNVGMASYRATGGGDLGLAAWEAWSARNPDNGKKDSCAKRWENYRSSPPDSIGAGTLFYLAAEAEKEAAEARRAANVFAEGIAKIKKDEQDAVNAKVVQWALSMPEAAKAVFGMSGPLAEALEAHRVWHSDSGDQGLYDYLARERSLSEEDRKDRDTQRAKAATPLSKLAIRFSDLMAEADEPTEWIIDGLIEKDILNVLPGLEQSWKSWLIQQGGICIAAGEPLLGMKVRKGVTVVYLSHEDDRRELKRRGKKIAIALGVKERDLPFIYPDLVSNHKGPLIRVDQYGEAMTTPMWDELRAYLKSIPGHKYVPIDSGYNVFSFAGASRNNEDAVGAALRKLSTLCGLCDCTLDVLHHPSRAGSERGDMGGAPAWDSVPRNRRSMKRDTNPGVGDLVTLTQEKVSHGQKMAPIVLRFTGNLLVRASEQMIADRDAALRAAVLRVAGHLAFKGGPVSLHYRVNDDQLAQMTEAAGFDVGDSASVKKVLRSLVAAGELREHANPEGGHYAKSGFYEPIRKAYDLFAYCRTVTPLELADMIKRGCCPADIKEQTRREFGPSLYPELEDLLDFPS